MHDDDPRSIELSSVEAIFPELVNHGDYKISLEIPVPLSKPVRVVFPATQQIAPAPVSLHDTLSSQQKPDSESAFKEEVHHLWNLPPLQATIALPEGYPENQPPSVRLIPSEAWIPPSKLSELADVAQSLWREMGCDMVVYSYIEYVQEAAERCFDLATSGTLDIPPELKVALLDYDSKVKKDKFDKETFDCMMCLEPKKGAVCHRLLDCGDVFCVECLQDYFNNCILEGDVDNVKCINPDCGKNAMIDADGRQRRKKPKKLQPSELLQIPIAEEKVQRYVKIRRKRKLEANPNTIYCPRKWCQGPARVGDKASGDEADADSSDDETEQAAAPVPEPATEEADEADERDQSETIEKPKIPPPGERLAVCTDCSFPFCLVCKKTWHGEFGWCSVRHQGELSREERASEEYLKKHSTPCPTCNVRSQKIMGCNHMQCRQCKTHFCYLCSSWLSADNPYQHFNTLGTPCYQKLWELEQGDGAGAPARPQPPPIEVIFEEDPPPVNNGPAHAQQPARQRAQPPHQLQHNVGRRIPPPAPVPPAQQAEGGRGRRRAPQRAEPVPVALPGHGLQRFLELAAMDEEDDWDSDELEEIEDQLAHLMNVRAF